MDFDLSVFYRTKPIWGPAQAWQATEHEQWSLDSKQLKVLDWMSHILRGEPNKEAQDTGVGHMSHTPSK